MSSTRPRRFDRSTGDISGSDYLESVIIEQEPRGYAWILVASCFTSLREASGNQSNERSKSESWGSKK